MEWLDATGSELARQVLQRGTAAVYVIAFVSTLAQFPALLGERGLLPVPDFLRTPYGRRQPTVFRLHYSDGMLRAMCVVGILVALSLVAGLPQSGPPWLPLVAFLLLWGMYLSVVTVGQTFYSFGWESLLLEAGFVVAFLGSDEVAPPILVIVFLRWLVFRLEFGAGMIKLRGGREWRDLTALMYHHETQPMPGPLSRYAHLLPPWVHRLEVIVNHVAQLAVPFLLFLPQPVATIAACCILLTQLWLVVTGNFAWLNWLTIVLAFSAVGDAAVHAVLPAWPAEHSYPPTPLWFTILVLVVVAGLTALSFFPLRNLLSRHQRMNSSFNRFHLVNAYGAFGTVTKRRDEIELEATLAEQPTEDDWRPYVFKGKPGHPRRVPGWFAPYHLRLDWLMWFLALGADDRWFRPLLRRLLEADRATLRLLRRAPFGAERPRWVRARIARYRFATPAERRETGMWWMRGELRPYAGPVALPDDARREGERG